MHQLPCESYMVLVLMMKFIDQWGPNPRLIQKSLGDSAMSGIWWNNQGPLSVKLFNIVGQDMQINFETIIKYMFYNHWEVYYVYNMASTYCFTAEEWKSTPFGVILEITSFWSWIRSKIIVESTPKYLFDNFDSHFESEFCFWACISTPKRRDPKHD